MRHVLIIICVLLFPILVHGKTDLKKWSVCQDSVCQEIEPGQDIYKTTNFTKGAVTYSTLFKNPSDCQSESCWVFLGQVADTARVRLNGHEIADFIEKDKPYYIRHKSISLPLSQSLLKSENQLQVDLLDLNQTLFGLRTKNIFIGTYDQVYKASWFDYLSRTGITLLSAFSLLLLFFALLVVLIQVRTAKMVSLLCYAGFTSLYLFSFSEVPREYLDPLWASAPLHFSLRLLQDFFLFVLVVVFMAPDLKAWWIKTLGALYLVCISLFSVFWLSGIQNYEFYIRYLHFCVFLQTIPMVLGLVLALRLRNIERRILGISFAFLCVLQVYDHFVFYQWVRGFFFVRFYPSLIITLFVAIYIRRTSFEMANLASEAAVGGMMKQVSHDIRSPLSVLQVVGTQAKQLPEDIRLLLTASISRIEDIANDLLGKSKKKAVESLVATEQSQLLCPLIETLVWEKKVQHAQNSQIEIQFTKSSQSLSCCAKIDPVSFKRVLSNLLNNAIEALDGKGKVLVLLKESPKGHLIRIKDNGKGIPKSILSQLGKKGATFGKKQGSGLGLFHAKSKIKDWKGDLQVSSQEGYGTEILMMLPASDLPNWFANQLSLAGVREIVILDDDPSIHQIWRQRLQGFGIDLQSFQHFYKSKDLIQWYDNNSSVERLFLCDYQLSLDPNDTGLDAIEQLSIHNCSVLVTSQYEDPDILQRCQRMGLKIIPKNLAGYVKIQG